MPKAADPFGTVADRAVYLPDADALVCADLHLGRAVATTIDVPLGECRTIVARLLGLIDRFAPAEVVLAGDILHAFGSVPREARAGFEELVAGTESRGCTLVTLAGNHDVQLNGLLDAPPGDAYELPDGTVVCHGHEMPTRTGRRYVVGHDHPAIVIEGCRRPCYLYGPGAHEGADVLALPAFNPGVPGTVVNRWRAGDALSPLMADASRFQPVVWMAAPEQALVFPPLDELWEYL